MNIDYDFLKEIPTEFNAESAEIKFIYTILKDLVAHVSFFTKKSQDQNKIVSLFGKNIISITNSISSDFNHFSSSDISHLSQIELIFLEIANDIGKIFSIDGYFKEIDLTSSTFFHEINSLTKGKNETLANTLNGLFYARSNYKSSTIKLERILKEIENLVNAKRTLDPNDLGNTKMIEKKDIRILIKR